MKKATLLLVLVFYSGCRYDGGVEKHQYKRDHITNVHDRIKEIKMDSVLIGSINRSHVTKDYLLICDFNSPNEQIHFFNKHDFSHVTSIAPRGQGPGEIAGIGHMAIDDTRDILFVPDHGKQKIFVYEPDSVIANPQYMPEVKMTMNRELFPDKYWYINDSLSIGTVIEPKGNAAFSQYVAKLNMNTGEIKKMKYEHPDIERKRVNLAVSVENNIYVECYAHHDLMTVCTLEGDLKYNIYGRYWNDRTSNRFEYFRDVVFCNDKIVALYSERKSREDNSCPTRLLVFNLSGDYLQTLETGYQIMNFCYDKAHHRIILDMNDDIQFGYLDLDGIVD
jgi:hypothetical protein